MDYMFDIFDISNFYSSFSSNIWPYLDINWIYETFNNE